MPSDKDLKDLRQTYVVYRLTECSAKEAQRELAANPLKRMSTPLFLHPRDRTTPRGRFPHSGRNPLND